jgi:hypothetical protein
MIVFGGYDGHYLDDGWALTLDGSPRWTGSRRPTHPGPTDFHTMAYDPTAIASSSSAATRPPLGSSGAELRNPILRPPPVAIVAGEPRPRGVGRRLTPGSSVPLLQVTVPSVAPARLEQFRRRRPPARGSLVHSPAAAGRNAIPLAEARGLHAGIYLCGSRREGSVPWGGR